MATFSDRPWGAISEADYADADAFCSACLIDLNLAGDGKTKANCKLPVREPGGATNRNALRAAAAVLAGARGGVSAPADEKRAAARKIMRLMSEGGMTAGESLRRLAGS